MLFFPRDNLSEIKDGVSVKLDGKQSKRTHQVLLFVDRNTAVYFDSFGIEYIPEKPLSNIKDKAITHNVIRIQVVHFIK